MLISGTTTAAESRWPACDPQARTQTLSFVHIADVHAHYNPDSSGGSPLARVRGLVEQVRQDNPFTLFTNAGDDYEKGSIAEALSQGRSTRAVTQAMGYDVRTLGNHDFAWGLQELLAFSQDPRALVLAANVRMIAPPPAAVSSGWTDYGALAVGCLRVGFFGLVSQPWNEKDEPYDGSFFPQLAADFRYVERAREIIARHRGEVDLLVLLSHLGFEEDRRLAEATTGIDLILGGHSHTTLAEPARVGATHIVHVGGHAEHIGRLDLEFDLQSRAISGHRFTLVPNGATDGPPADPAIQAAVAEVLRPYAEALTQPFAWVDRPLGPAELAQVAAEAAVEGLGVDAALVGLRSAWGGWGAGGLTQQQVLDAFKVERQPAGTPGFSSLYRIEASGADLLRMQELPGFAYWGPTRPEPGQRYQLALQKPLAFHQVAYFGRRIAPQTPEPLAELWQAVAALGQLRRAAGLALNSRAPAGGDDRLIAFAPPSDGPMEQVGM